MYFTYVLKSDNRKYIYVGITNNAERRIKEYQNGKERTTKPYRPFETILIEEYSTREKARIREKYLKSGIGKEWIKKHILNKPM